MSQPAVDVLEEQSVVASLHPGPKGTVRLSYEYPHPEVPKRFLDDLVPPAQIKHAYVASPIVELDRAKLLELRFSQEELAEIGFSLVLRLSGLLRYGDA